MNRREPFDVALAGWLDDEAAGAPPAGLHESAMRAAATIRQRPAWLVTLRGARDAGPRVADRPAIAARPVLVALLLLLAAAVAIVAAGWLRDRDRLLGGVTNGRILFAREQLGENPNEKAQYGTIGPDGAEFLPLIEAEKCGQCMWWSPDGDRIMLPSVADPDRLGTAIVDPDGSDEIVVPFPDATLFLGPGGWAPDGRILLEGFDPTDPTRPEVGLYVANADGSGLRQLTSSTDGRSHVFPTVSPDGRFVVFVAQDPDPPGIGAFSGDLFIVAMDGTGLRQVNPAGTKVVVGGETGRPADWSPDGRLLAYARTNGSLAAGRSAVYVTSPDGGSATRISDQGVHILSVDWSPDGSWLAYWEGNVPNLVAPTWVASPDGGTTRQLMGVGTGIQGCCPTWSPDSTLLLVQRFEVGGRDLWTMDVQGRLVQRITHDPGAYIWYSWAPAP